MRCEEVRDWMQRDLDSDLNDIERQALTNHLAKCTECAAYYHQLQKLSAHLEQLPDVQPSYSLVDAVLPKLQEIDRERAENHQHRDKETSRRSSKWRGTFLGGAVAAGLVFALFITNNPFQQGSDQSMDQNLSMEESAGIAESTALPEADFARDGEDQSVSAENEKINMMIAPDQGQESYTEANDTLELVRASIVSPDGDYIAEIVSVESNMRLQIRSAAQGELIFTSRQFPGDYEFNLEWIDNGRLSYRLYGGNATEIWEVSIAPDGSSREQLVMRTETE